MKKIIKKLHLYIALIFCLPLILQGLTGSILVFEHEISKKKYDLASGEKQKISAIIFAAQNEVDEDFKVNFIKFDEAANLRFSKKEAEKNLVTEVVVDPVSLKILEKKNPEENFFRWIKKFHTSLLIKGDLGKNIVGIYGFILLFMTISGIVLWWPKPGNLKRALTFKFSSEGKKFHRDLHGAVGFWLSILLLITSFSGIYLAYPKATTSFVTKFFPGRDLKEAANAIKVAGPRNECGVTKYEARISSVGGCHPALVAGSIDDLMALTQEDGELLSIFIPTKPDQPYRFNFAPKNHQEGAPLITIFIDQYQQKIIEKRDPENYSVGEKIIAWQHALHVGEEFGLVSKIAVFLVGLSLLLFSITGISLWWMKKKK